MARILRKQDLENAINTAQTDPLKKGLAGELEVINVLESSLPESCIIIWDPAFLRYKPDILVIDSNLGFLFIEVKNWSLPYVKQFLSNGKSETFHGLKHPHGQTDNYINEMQSYVNSMKEKQLDIYRFTSSLVIYTGFSKDDFLNRSEVRNWEKQNLQDYFKKHLFLDDLKISPYSKLMSSKKFHTKFHTLFTPGELNYLAKSLSHTDTVMREDGKSATKNAVPSDSEVLQKENAVNFNKEKSIKKLKILLYSLCFLLFFSILYATADFFLNPSDTYSNSVDTEYSRELYDKALEDAKFALANGEYEQALGLYEMAYMENPDDPETKAMFESLMKLHDLGALAEDGEWENVITSIDALNDAEKVSAQLERQYQQLYKEATEMQNSQTALEGVLKETDSLIVNKEFEQAQSLLDILKADHSIARVVEKNETKIISLYGQIEKGIEELEVQEKELVTKSRQEPIKVQPVSNGAKYTDKLSQIENSLKELDHLYVDGVTSKILEGEIETFERWDDALNEIYGVLKTTLSASEMESLRNEQRDWISYRDHEAEVSAAEFEGGTFEAVTLVSVKQQLTKDRCFTLVRNYME